MSTNCTLSICPCNLKRIYWKRKSHLVSMLNAGLELCRITMLQIKAIKNNLLGNICPTEESIILEYLTLDWQTIQQTHFPILTPLYFTFLYGMWCLLTSGPWPPCSSSAEKCCRSPAAVSSGRHWVGLSNTGTRLHQCSGPLTCTGRAKL